MRAELAEYALLAEYDRLRQRLGHDYGCGQRGAELIRRRRRLQVAGADAHTGAATVTGAELGVAWRAVGAARLRRLELEPYRQGTPSSRRSLAAWRQVRAWAAERAAAE